MKSHILEKEQAGLCIYCESKVKENGSHLEHLKPKSASKYPELTFIYSNITVSCDGNNHTPEYDNSRESCGHIKDDEYNDTLFLDPTLTQDIREYFKYDYDDYKIYSTDKSPDKANYMITTLKLNEGELPTARKNVLKAFRRALTNIADINKRKMVIRDFITKDDTPFVSFLYYKYCHI